MSNNAKLEEEHMLYRSLLASIWIVSLSTRWHYLVQSTVFVPTWPKLAKLGRKYYVNTAQVTDWKKMG